MTPEETARREKYVSYYRRASLLDFLDSSFSRRMADLTPQNHACGFIHPLNARSSNCAALNTGGRSGKWAKAFLDGFSGVLITDGYSGYNKVHDAEHAGCSAHMRRKRLDAMPDGTDATTCNAEQGYAFCNRLFELDRSFEKLSAEERLIQRKEKVGPVLEAYWTWLNTISRPTGKLKNAVTYAQNQNARLCAFLERGEIEISNKQDENTIRPFVIAGRDGSLPIRPRVRRRVQSSIRLRKRQKPTT